MLKPIICPSLLSGDWSFLAQECNSMLEMGADYLHMDVMDGHFVPNLTIGAPVIRSLRKHTKGYLDCHLMVSHPEQWIKDFSDAGADGFTFHVEAAKDSVKLVHECIELKMNPGLAIKPSTSIETMYPIIDAVGVDKIGLALIMTVEPGFGGQSFMVDQMSKVTALRVRYPQLNIQVDGGLTLETVPIAVKAGANVIVAGSSIFTASNKQAVISSFRTMCHQSV